MNEHYGLEIEKAAFFPEPDKNLFTLLQQRADGRAYKSHNGMIIIASVEIVDGVEWLHVSFSRKSRMPDYKDIQLVKHHFFGDDKKAVMIFPEKENYINIHKYCLHLFYSAKNPLPEFSAGGSI